jgi:hypothetical protein
MNTEIPCTFGPASTSREVEGERGIVPPHVEKACALLVREGRRFLPDNGGFRTTLLHVHRRTQSTIYVIALRNGRAEKRFYLKTLNLDADGRDAKVRAATTEYRVLEELSARFAPYPQLGVVEPVASMPEDLSLLMEESPGEKFDVVLARTSRHFRQGDEMDRSVSLCRLAGEWLRRFQDFTAPSRASTYDPSELLAYCDERLRIIMGDRCGWLTRERSATIRRHLEHLVARLDPEELRLTGRQNDFRPDNMLTRDGKLVVLDFTGFTYGPPLYDFMKFWMRLDYLGFGPASAMSRIERMKRAFAEGYEHPVNLRSSMAALLRLANILDKMSELVEMRPAGLARRIFERLWYRHLYAQIASAAGADGSTL